MINNRIVSVIGGRGFIGQYLVNFLLNRGSYVNIISRSAKVLKPKFTLSKLGQLNLINCDIKSLNQLKNALKGSDIVINLSGLLAEKKNNNFNQVHNIGTENLVNACIERNVKKILHISAIGADIKSKSKYARTKYLGEKNIKLFKNYTILRPSVVYGDEDNFINYFAKLSKISPIIPLIGNGRTKFQPIWVQDLINIIGYFLDINKNKNKLVEVGGEEVVSFKEILTKINLELDQKRYYLNLPFQLAKRFAFFTEKMPVPILTRDQVELLKSDNIVSRKLTYKRFIKYKPKPFDMILEKQLIKFRKKGGHYS